MFLKTHVINFIIKMKALNQYSLINSIFRSKMYLWVCEYTLKQILQLLMLLIIQLSIRPKILQKLLNVFSEIFSISKILLRVILIKLVKLINILLKFKANFFEFLKLFMIKSLLKLYNLISINNEIIFCEIIKVSMNQIILCIIQVLSVLK